MSGCRVEQGKSGYKICGLLNYETVVHIYQEGTQLLDLADCIRFDFAEVTHADSSAIAMLLSWLRYAKKQRKAVIFMNLPMQLIEIANVCEIMPLLDPYLEEAYEESEEVS